MTNYSQNSNMPNVHKVALANYLKKSSLILVVGMFLAATVGYMVEINSIAAKGYQIKHLEEQIDSAKEENDKLELQVIEMQSMSTLQEKVAQLNMVPVDRITYFESTGPVVAQR